MLFCRRANNCTPQNKVTSDFPQAGVSSLYRIFIMPHKYNFLVSNQIHLRHICSFVEQCNLTVIALKELNGSYYLCTTSDKMVHALKTLPKWVLPRINDSEMSLVAEGPLTQDQIWSHIKDIVTPSNKLCFSRFVCPEGADKWSTCYLFEYHNDFVEFELTTSQVYDGNCDSEGIQLVIDGAIATPEYAVSYGTEGFSLSIESRADKQFLEFEVYFSDGDPNRHVTCLPLKDCIDALVQLKERVILEERHDM